MTNSQVDPNKRLIGICQLDRALPLPLYVQLSECIEQAIMRGHVGAGDRLPSARALARQCGTTAVTVRQAYQHLMSRGMVVSRIGSGTYVSGSAAKESGDLASGVLHLDRREPPPILFPTQVIRRIMDRILDEEGGEAFSYGDPAGDPALKEVLRGELIESGFAVSGRDLIIFSGAQQALSLLSRAFLQRGDWVLLERPAYPGMLRLLQQAGARIEYLEVDPAGPDPRRVAQVLATRPIRLFYSNPVYHNPTGICWSEERKQRIAELCEGHGVTIIEDDALSGLDFGNGRPRPLAVCAPTCSRVIYIRSFSLILMPGFRLGMCLASRQAANTLTQAKEQADLLSSEFFQRVLCRFISEGHMRRHLSVIESYYRDLFARGLAAVNRELVARGFRVTPPAGGPSVWCRLPDNVPGAGFLRECIRRDVVVVPGRQYSLDESTADGFGIAFSRLRQDQWEEGLARVVDAAAAARASGS